MQHRRLFAAAVVAAAFVAPATAAAQQFEGVVKQRIVVADRTALEKLAGPRSDSSPYGFDPARVFDIAPDDLAAALARDAGGGQEVTIQVKAPQMRVDGALHAAGAATSPAGSRMYMLMDGDRGTMTLVNPANEQALVWSVEDLQALMEKMPDFLKKMGGQAADAGPEPELRELGKAKINGFEVRGYELKTDDYIARGWVTADAPKDLGLAMARFKELETKMKAAGMAPENSRDPMVLLGRKGTPVRIQVLSVPDGRYVVSELLSIEAQPLPAELFAVPEGFAVNKMMGGQMD